MSLRVQNEKKFGTWKELPDGGRRNWLNIAGRLDWRARYVKQVGVQESTDWKRPDARRKTPSSAASDWRVSHWWRTREHLEGWTVFVQLPRAG